MKFPKVTRRVFLILPAYLLSFLAEPTLVLVSDLGEEAVICLARLKPTWEVVLHLVDLVAVKITEQPFLGHTIHKHYEDPIDCESASSVAFARLLQLDRVGFVRSRNALPGPAVASGT